MKSRRMVGGAAPAAGMKRGKSTLRFRRRAEAAWARVEGRATPVMAELLEGRVLLSSFVVTNTNDSGTGSLRAAVIAANNNPGDDTITFDAGVFQVGTSHVIAIGSSLDITDTSGQTSIVGPGPSTVAVRSTTGSNAPHVMWVHSGAALAVSGLTLSYGSIVIYNDGGDLAVTDCVINGALDFGIEGSATVANSLIEDNGSSGLYCPDGTITNCTILDNGWGDPGWSGGGIDAGGVTVIGSTIVGNRAVGEGGGIYTTNPSVVTNCTIVGNTATGDGGGIDPSSRVILCNSVVTGNISMGNPARNDITGGLAAGSSNNIISADAMLAPLGLYGGSTYVMPPFPGSPAIDQGRTSKLPPGTTTDVRGFARVVGASVDIGACESQGFHVSVATGDNQTTSTNTPFPAPLKVSVDSTMEEPVNGGTVTFSAPVSGASCALSPLVASLNSQGQASVTAVANDGSGAYQVTATTAGAVASATFNLVNAGPLMVTTTADETNPNDNQISLREAIAYANSTPGADTINFDPNLFTPGVANVVWVNQPLAITDTGGVYLSPPAGIMLKISGYNTGRVITVAGGACAQFTGVEIAEGGISNAGTLTLSNCTITGSSATSGGAIYSTGTLGAANCTISGNSASTFGGGIYSDAGSVSLINCTISGNSAGAAGSGVFVANITPVLHNTLIAGNTPGSASDYVGNLPTAGTGNIIGGNPLLAPLDYYGGTTKTMALLPGSPAIDAGSSMLAAGSTDQRGFARILGSAVDAGAFESRGFTITGGAGAGQSTMVGTAFASPLTATVTSPYSEPIAGGQVTFVVPASGASAAFSPNPVTLGVSGAVSASATANATAGHYAVSATCTGAASPAVYALSNAELPSLVVNTTADVSDSYDGVTSLREAVAYANSHIGSDTITFSASVFTPGVLHTITLTQGQLTLADTVGTTTIQGPGASVLAISGNNASRIFATNDYVAAQMSGLTLTAGREAMGPAVESYGTTTIMSCVITANTATYGGAIFNIGPMSISSSTISGNAGGGIINDRTLSLDKCTFSGNQSNGTNPTGGAIYNEAALGLDATNCTFTNNSATQGGALYLSGGPLTFTNCTIAGNSATIWGGGIYVVNFYRAMTLRNTVIAGNTAPNCADLSGDVDVNANSLIGGNPLLSPLGNYGGGMQTVCPLPGSPLIDAGTHTGAPATDERGVTRSSSAPVDIGAVESQGFTLVYTSGNSQRTACSTAFPAPLNVAVQSAFSEPTAGGAVTWTLPLSGASANLSANPSTIGPDGHASVTATANGTSGTYSITAGASGASVGVVYTLTNLNPLIVTTTSDTVDPNDGQISLREAVNYASAHAGADTITFDPGVFTSIPHTITLNSPLSLTDTSGLIAISTDGAGPVTLSGTGIRLIQISPGVSVSLTGLGLSGGSAPTSSGGAVLNSGSLTLNRCSVSGSQALSGGGVYSSGSLTAVNCTFSANQAQWGGALSIAGTTSLTNCTIALNSATSSGGGVYVSAGSLELANTLVAKNTAPSSADILGAWSGSTLTNMIGGEPLLAALDYYGGNAKTLPLLPGSPAMDAGDNSLCTASTDEAGHNRKVGTIDIGAVESQGFTLSVLFGDYQVGRLNAAFASSLVAWVSAAYNLPVIGGKVTFTAPASGAGASLSPTVATIDSNGRASSQATANGTAGTYTVSATTTELPGSAPVFHLTNLDPLKVTTVNDESNPNDSTISLREAMAFANSNPGPDTITFDPSLLPATFSLNDGQLGELLATDPAQTTINGVAGSVAISGINAFRVFHVNAGASLLLKDMTLTEGCATGDNGGAIYNAGQLTLSNVWVSDSAAANGAGIYGAAGSTTSLSNCVIMSNTATSLGGGIYDAGTLTLTSAQINANHADRGGGIYAAGDSASYTSTDMWDNSADWYGGAVYASSAHITVTAGTCFENAANAGGGGFYVTGGTLTAVNYSITNNSTPSNGGGLANVGGAITALTNCTFDANSATGSGGGINNLSGTVRLYNTLLASDSAGSNADFAGTLDGSSSHNLMGTGFLVGSTGAGITPALLPGSPAIDAGDISLIPPGITTDGRGAPRIMLGSVDVGAYETHGFALTITGGNNQGAITNHAFSAPLRLSVTPLGGSDAVAGGVITFSAPTSGASATLSTTQATISGGYASVNATANATAGHYSVTASAAGVATPVSFNLTNTDGFTVTTTNDIVNPNDGVTSLREAVNRANSTNGANIITFDPTVFTPGSLHTITLSPATGELAFTDTSGQTSIQGPGADVLAVAMGVGINAARVFHLNSGTSVALSGMSILNGAPGSSANGGGIWSVSATLTVSDCAISNNGAANGAGAYISGGTASFTNCLISANTAGTNGGGIYDTSGTVTLVNCTLNGNNAVSGGGIYSAGTTTLTNCTVSGNSATAMVLPGGGGVYKASGSLVLKNTILAGNTAASSDPNLHGSLDSPSSHNLVGSDPMLGSLASNGGPTQTMKPLTGSPAINGGDSSLVPSGITTDQRGFGYQRIVSTVDIGAYEVQNPAYAVLGADGSATGLFIYGSDHDDTITISRSGANVAVSIVNDYSTVNYTFAASSITGKIHAYGLGGQDTCIVDATSGAIGPDVTFDGGTGTDTWQFTAGNYTFAADVLGSAEYLQLTGGVTATFTVSQHPFGLTIGVASTATLAQGGGLALVTSSLSFDSGAHLDLNDNVLIFRSATSAGDWAGASYSGIAGMVASGAIRSTTANNDTTHNHGLALMTAAQAIAHGHAATGGAFSLNGETVSGNDVVAQCRWNGDLNLDGQVNYLDYGVIDNAWLSHAAPSPANGDLNLDGAINYLDYGMMDNAFLATSAPHSAAMAAEVAPAVSSPVVVPGASLFATASLASKPASDVSSVLTSVDSSVL